MLHVLAGNSALDRNGLTTLLCNSVSLFTNVKLDKPVKNTLVSYYSVDETLKSSDTEQHDNYLVPTKERAILEYIKYLKYFDEGLLEEAMRSYRFQLNDDWSKLRALAPKYNVDSDTLEYWINEAYEPEE